MSTKTLIYETEKGYVDAQNMGPELLTALANFQNECPTIPKNKKGYGYNYAEFSKAIELMKPILHKHKMGFTQLLEGSDNLRTIIFHGETGQYLQTVKQLPTGYELKGMNLYQTEGARNTYYKRYVLFNMLGVVSEDEDTDAKGQTKPVKNETPEKQPTPKATLNNNQFIQLLGAVNAGDITVKQAFDSYELNQQQKNTLENL
ncbi:Essential recombination function protein [uncultured Caudovirales phage]|uniref:Essential recombination function protein n=1 Tax=uncultured Caudovirales phage TaxID=2100421 RepID=A0A6J5N634_9CAUD|nr:Essential recombination function protein [uncultured Caudovirales phage]